MASDSSCRLVSGSARDTQELGARLGSLFKRGDVGLLIANLGSGKTTLIQGVARQMGVRHHALSPTFILAQTLKGRVPLHHLDFYRVRKGEIWHMGIDDYLLGTGAIEKGVVLIEWAERCKEIWPKERLEIKIKIKPKSTRRLITLTARGPRYRAILKEIKKFYAEH